MSKDTDKTTNEKTNNEAKRFSRAKIAVVAAFCVLGAAVIVKGAFLVLKEKDDDKVDTEYLEQMHDNTVLEQQETDPLQKYIDAAKDYNDPNVLVPHNDIEHFYEEQQGVTYDSEFTVPEADEMDRCQVTDDMLAYMKEQADEQFYHWDINQIPFGFEVEDYHYVGMVVDRTSDEYKEALMTLYYQITISEGTGDDIKYHHYFWSMEFAVDYEDNKAQIMVLGSTGGRTIYFGKWAVSGISSIDIDIMRKEKNTGRLVETNTVDPDLFSPLPGEDEYITPRLERVTCYDEINEGQRNFMIDQTMLMMDFYFRPKDTDLERIRYRGMVIASKGDSSTVYTIIEVEATMNKGTPDEEYLKYYWYIGYKEVYKTGELDDNYVERPSVKIPVEGWNGTGFTDINDLRKAIIEENENCEFDLHFEE
ncbi:MAG: hypothetical protein J5653_02020 [Clostridiales bacterium]|nr:hypothetical protein [Clostridiales bacterium]